MNDRGNRRRHILYRANHTVDHARNAADHALDHILAPLAELFRQALQIGDGLLHHSLHAATDKARHILDAAAHQLNDLAAQLQPVEGGPHIHNCLYDLRQIRRQCRDRLDKPLPQRDDQLHARRQQLRCVVVDDARNVRHNARQIHDHRRQSVHQPGCQIQNELDARIHQLPGILAQAAGKVRHNRQGLRQKLGDAGHKAVPQLAQQGRAGLQKLRPDIGGQVGKYHRQTLRQPRNAVLLHTLGQCLQVAARQRHGLAQSPAHGIKQRRAQILGVGFHAVQLVGHRVGHRVIGRLCRAAVGLHLLQHTVELVRAGACQRQCARTGLHAAPQSRKLRCVAAHAVVQHLQHIAQALAVGVQFGKALAGLLLQDFAHARAGVAQLVQHRLCIGRGLRRSDTVGRHDGQPAGQVLHAHVVGSCQRYDPAHAARQLVNAGLAQILGRQQHIRNMSRLVRAFAVSVQCRCQDVHRRCGGCKASRCQHGRLPGKGHGVAGVLPGADGLIGRLGDLIRADVHITGHLQHLTAQAFQRHFRRVGDRAHLGHGALKRSAAGKGALQHLADARRRHNRC